MKMVAIGETNGFSLLHFSVGSSNAVCGPSQSRFGIQYRIKCIWSKFIYFQKINQESNCTLRRFLTGVNFMFIYDHPLSHLADETILNFHSLIETAIDFRPTLSSVSLYDRKSTTDAPF